MSTQQQYTNYASFNTLTIQGRISYSEVKSGRNGEFLTVTVISTLVRDGAETDIQFTDSQGLLNLFKAGYLRSGSVVTLTGRLNGISETFTNKDGELQMRQRPMIDMTQVHIMTGGLGPIPKRNAENNTRRANVRPQAAAKQAPVNETPVDEAPVVDAAEAAALW